MNNIRHSIIMMVYNQEKLLPVTLDSLFSQSILPYEVIIGDDCSSDNTWNVIQDYYRKYPDIIKPIRNEKNLGIFGNFNKLKKMPSGDIVSFLSGDDLYKPGIFEAFNTAIEANQLKPQEHKFILITNAIDLYPSGKEVVYNNYRFRNKDLFKLKVRYSINFRDTGFSINLFRIINPIIEGIGYHADWIYCIDQLIKSEKFIFINKAFPVYRMDVGAVSKSKSEDLLNSKIQVIRKIFTLFASHLDKKDTRYLTKELLISQYALEKDIKILIKASWFLLLNLNNYSSYSKMGDDFKTITLFYGGAVLRLLKLRL